MAINLFKILKAGTFTSMAGRDYSFSVRDLEQTAAFYTHQRPKAPLVLGHPVDNGPAFGTVLGLSTKGDALFAEADVSNELTQMVRAGHYKYVSAALYPSGLTGVWSLRHVGMLGAVGPAVKGLGSLEFSEHKAGTCKAMHTTFFNVPGLGTEVNFGDAAEGGTPFQIFRERMHIAITRMMTQYPEFSYLEAARMVESMIQRQAAISTTNHR